MLRERNGESPGPTNTSRRFPELGARSATSSRSTACSPTRDSTRAADSRPHADLFGRHVLVGGPAVPRPAAAPQGGLGAVFVALDAELHREVALKQILDRHADDPVSRSRFLIEAEITGGLEHPGIVPVYGLGTYGRRPAVLRHAVHQGRQPQGRHRRLPWRRVVESRPGPAVAGVAELLRRFVDVCNAIEYAHSRGVLHRDIKPGNIIVGKHGETLVVDWGLAKAVGRADPGAPSEERTLVPSSASGSAETLPGSALGTPAFMSPEQADGDLARLGPRSDVYSLGATLYCCSRAARHSTGNDVGAVLEGGVAGRLPAAAAARPVDRPASRGDLPEGDGAAARRPLRLAPGAGRRC